MFPLFGNDALSLNKSTLMKASEDYLEISASVSQHRYFCLMSFFLAKIKHLYPIHLNILSFGW